jgi:hypothetical protein
MPSPVRAAVAIEPAASADEIAAILAVLTAASPVEATVEREPAWRVAARREATGATI